MYIKEEPSCLDLHSIGEQWKTRSQDSHNYVASD